MRPEITIATWSSWAYADTKGRALLGFCPIGEAWRARRVAGYVPDLLVGATDMEPLGELDVSLRLGDMDLSPGSLREAIPTGLLDGSAAPEWICWTGAEPKSGDAETAGVLWRQGQIVRDGAWLIYPRPGAYIDAVAEALKAAGWAVKVFLREDELLAA